MPAGFQRNNQYGSAAHKRTLGPIENLRRKAKDIYVKVRAGRLDSNRGNTCLASLRLQLELADRGDLAEAFAKYEREIQKLEARVAALLQHRSASLL